MTDNFKQQFISQALAMANNYFCTGRPNKALEMLEVVKKVDPENQLLKKMMHKVFCVATGEISPDLEPDFGKQWRGEPLEDKKIEIFCDQGMGDTLNLLRYVLKLKQKYNCNIVLNCYAFFNQFERLLTTQGYIDEFTPFHIKSDYVTNIMSLPALLNGLDFEIYYPVHFTEIMKCEIPRQPFLGPFHGLNLNGSRKVGIVWQSNSDNPLSIIKSIPIEAFDCFQSMDVNFYCLQPKIDTPEWIQSLPIEDLYDTAAFIQQCDCVVSVDTVTFHLAGMMGKKTFGLLPYDTDPRWGNSDKCLWYSEVELFRQKEDKDWSSVILNVKNSLESFLKIK